MLIKWKNRIDILWMSLCALHTIGSAHQSSTWPPKLCTPAQGTAPPKFITLLSMNLTSLQALHWRWLLPSLLVNTHTFLLGKFNYLLLCDGFSSFIRRKQITHSFGFHWPFVFISIIPFITWNITVTWKLSFSFVRCWAFEGSNHA